MEHTLITNLVRRPRDNHPMEIYDRLQVRLRGRLFSFAEPSLATLSTLCSGSIGIDVWEDRWFYAF